MKLKVLCLLIIMMLVGVGSSASPDVHRPIITSEPSLSATVLATGDTITMDVELIDGRLHVSDSVHSTKNLRVLESMLFNRLDGYNGKEVMLYHVNDAGVKDSSRLVPIQSDGTWTYFYDVEFSEVIIDGFVGTWEVSAYNISVSDSLNFGQTFNASDVTSLSVNVTDDASAMSKYDYIESTNPNGWWLLDDNYTDMSGNGYNGTAYGDTYFMNGKYNNASISNVGGYVNLGNVFNADYNAFTILFYANITLTGTHNMLLEASDIIFNDSIHIYKRDSDTMISFRIGTVEDSGDYSYSPDLSTYFNKLSLYELNYDDSLNIAKIYADNNYIGSFVCNGTINISNDLFISKTSVDDVSEFDDIFDNLIIYNRVISSTERNNFYYDHLQQLQIKTNSNSTWSTEWNSTADNPIQVPYADGEFFSLLNFTVPETVVQNGITIYDYPSTVQFDAIATVGYTEDITKITETATAGTYTLNITHAANNTGEGYINYTTANTVLLDADFWNSAVLTTDNPNASLSTTLPLFSINTGYVAVATEYYYLIEHDYFYPPTNIQTTPSQCCVNISWDAVPNADNYSVYVLEDGFPYVNTNPVVDGIKDAIYDYAHEFLIFSPNPMIHGDYGTIYPVRTALGAYFLIECVDNDNKKGDDDTIYYFDLDNNGLTTSDYAWKITDNIVKRYNWDGASWKVAGGSNAVGASTGGGTHYPIHELFIPIAELGANWTNGSTVKVLVKREDSSLYPDVITWYPYGNINDTDTSLWQEMVLNDPESYTFLGNTTNLWYNATGLTPFTIYHGAVTTWNGTQETGYGSFDVITEDTPYFNVSGYIFDEDNNLLSNAIVYSCNGFVHEITTTNESGYYIGYNFREGNYTICGNKSGYIQNSIDIYVSTNLTNQNITLSMVSHADIYNKLLDIEAQNQNTSDQLVQIASDTTAIKSNLVLLQLVCVLNFVLIIAIRRRDT